MDNCRESTDFRLAVKRTDPKIIQEAVTSAIKEEGLRLTENKKKNNRIANKYMIFEDDFIEDSTVEVDKMSGGVEVKVHLQIIRIEFCRAYAIHHLVKVNIVKI